MGDGINDAPALHAADVGISVDGAADVARAAADLILLEHDLSVVRDAVVHGRSAVQNVSKYVLMGSSSNFGNMFSMAGAALFLPFLPMLPIQVLLNNLLYDVSEIAIPFDRVDPEATARPVKWDIKLIERFMLVFGPLSSVFDFLTFYALLHLFGAGEALFQTGWFIEFDYNSGAGGLCHPHAATLLSKQAAQVPRRNGTRGCRRRGRTAASPSGPMVRFRRATAAVLRLPGWRDSGLSGSCRNRQGLFLPMCWQAMTRCCGRMEGEISVSVGHGQRRGTAGLMSYGAMRPLLPVAKCHRAICTTMACGTRLDTEIVTGDISRLWAVHRTLGYAASSKRPRSRPGADLSEERPSCAAALAPGEPRGTERSVRGGAWRGARALAGPHGWEIGDGG